MMQFFRRFKEVNDGLVAVIVISVLSVFHLASVAEVAFESTTVVIWIQAALMVTAVAWALIHKKYWIAAFILFLAGYSNSIGLFVNQIFSLTISNYWSFVRLFISAVAAFYLITLVIAYLVTQNQRASKNFSSDVMILSLVVALFIYIYRASFGGMLIVLIPVVASLVGGLSLSAVLLLVAITVEFPVSVIYNTVNGLWSLQTSQIFLLVLGVLVFILSVYVLIREIQRAIK